MKKYGILNSQLAGYIAALGHGDLIMIGDAGLPVPAGIPIVDLALCAGVPSFKQVLKAVLDETEIEYYYLAEEILGKEGLEQDNQLVSWIQDSMPGIKNEMMPHAEFKAFSTQVKFAIRTGEFTAYSNIVLRAGVTF